MRSLLYSLVLLYTTAPILVYGAGKVYAPLIEIPGNGADGFEQYISFLYGASISIAALLAVVKIIIAGAKYMLSDVITNKGEAIKDIQGAILGLLLILGAVVILEFINPQLVKRDIQFQTIAAPPKPKPQSPAVTATGGAEYTTQNGNVISTNLESESNVSQRALRFNNAKASCADKGGVFAGELNDKTITCTLPETTPGNTTTAIAVSFTTVTGPISKNSEAAYDYYKYDITRFSTEERQKQLLSFMRECTLKGGANLNNGVANPNIATCRITR